MMHFVIRAYDGEGMLDKRMEVRPRHLEGIDKMRKHVLCAGGLKLQGQHPVKISTIRCLTVR